MRDRQRLVEGLFGVFPTLLVGAQRANVSQDGRFGHRIPDPAHLLQYLVVNLAGLREVSPAAGLRAAAQRVLPTLHFRGWRGHALAAHPQQNFKELADSHACPFATITNVCSRVRPIIAYSRTLSPVPPVRARSTSRLEFPNPPRDWLDSAPVRGYPEGN